MKLPLSSPSTNSSPSGYAALISWPSWRGSAVVEFTRINAPRRARCAHGHKTTADPRDPDDLLPREDNWPARAVRTDDAGIAKEALDAPRPAGRSDHTITGAPRTDDERVDVG